MPKEIKGIDVSSYQGKPDWNKVKNDDIKYAILRIHQRNGIDGSFEYNYAECVKNHIPVGGYKFSYALTVAEAEKEADDTLKVLAGRKLDYPLFYDLEWSTQRNIGPKMIEKITLAFLNKVEKAGYKVGIYCNVDWYNNVLTNKLKEYDIWVSRYPYNDSGIIQERLRPAMGIAWQYSSKGKVNGINGNVDMNVFYKDYLKTNDSNKQEGGIKPMGITKDQAIDAMIACAEKEVGYLEKRSNAQLDSKKANAGSGNYTKYWRDLKPNWNGSFWCAIYVSWVFASTFGIETAKKLLKHENDFPYVYCPTLSKRFTLHSNPKRGDVVIFYRRGEFKHTGIVTKVQGDRFWTIEGNASSGTEITPNGGEVCKKAYNNSQLPGTKFCRPDYSIVTKILTKNPFEGNSTSSTPNLITRPLNKTTKYTASVTANSLNVRVQPTTDAEKCSFGPLKKDTVVNVCDTINGWHYICHEGKYGFVSAQYVTKNSSQDMPQKPENAPQKPSVPTGRKFVGCVYKPVTKVYKDAQSKELLSEYPELRNGNMVDVLAEEGKRYKVNIPVPGGLIGYVNKSDIKDSKKEYPYLAKVHTNGGTLNLREKPVDGNTIVKMPNHANVIVRKEAKEKGWYEIRYKKQIGYASGEYLRKA